MPYRFTNKRLLSGSALIKRLVIFGGDGCLPRAGASAAFTVTSFLAGVACLPGCPVLPNCAATDDEPIAAVAGKGISDLVVIC